MALPPQLDPGIDAMIDGAAAQSNVNANLLRATILQESGGNPSVSDSSAGAKGIAQFLPATLQGLMGPDANPYEVPTALAGAAKYLAEGLSKGEALGVADPGVYAARYYNGGPRGPENPATEEYARQVARRYAALTANSAAAAPAPSPGAGEAAAPAQSALSAPSAGGGPSVPQLNLPQVPSDADLALLAPDLQPLARAGLLTPEQAAAAITPPTRLAEAGTGDWTPGNDSGGLVAGGALLRSGGISADAGAMPADLAALRAAAAPAAGASGAPRPASGASPAAADAPSPAPGADAAPIQSTPSAASPGAAASPQLPDVSKLSDEELVNGIASGKIPAPWLNQPGGAAAVPPAASGGASPAPASAPSGASPPAIGVQKMIDDYNFYSSFPAGLGFAQQIYKNLSDAAPQGFQLNQDGSLSLRPGYAQGEGAVAGAKATAEQEQARVTQLQQAEQARITAAVAPQRTRAGEGVVYPPGSPLAPGGSLSPLPAPGTTPAAGAAAGPPTPATAGGPAGSGGGAPGVLTATAGGGASIAGTPPPQSTETFYKRFEQLGDAADAARSGLQLADQLQERLHALPSTGPLAPGKAELSAALSQFGVSPQQLQAFWLPAPGATESADKLSIDLLSDILHRTFPGGRITNADIQTMMPTVARAATPMAANDYLINSVLKPRLQRDVDRYSAVVDLPQTDPTLASLPSKLNQWDLKPGNTYASYLKRAQAGVPAEVPAGSRQIGTRNGIPVWQTPDGRRVMVR